MTVAELKLKAKSLGIKGAESMKKAELEKAIEIALADQVAAQSRGASSADAPKSGSIEHVPVANGSSSVETDFQMHPKFHKFKAKGETQP